jgi:Fe2+ or Zn2+ uptake regulation protein
MKRDLVTVLMERGIQPSAQRVAVADHVLHTDRHPSADEVWARVRARFPTISRATVYNTLHLFADNGLLRELVLAEGKVVFDPNMEPHHHFIDDSTGAIEDVPWSAVQVENVESLKGVKVREYQVVMRGRKLHRPAQLGSPRGPRPAG